MHNEALTKTGEKVFPLLAQFPGFYLAGGTALAIQIGHRVSLDFDMFTGEPIKKTFLRLVESVFEPHQIKPVVNNRGELTVFTDDVKITFLQYPFPLLLPLANVGNLPVLSVPEIAVTKAYTLGRRGAYKDYVDLYFCLAERLVTLEQIIELAAKKYGDAFSDRLFLEQLVYWEDIEETGILFLKPKVVKSELIRFFESSIKRIHL
jgi:hypothetical protein